MKTFWLLICLLVVGGATYFAWEAVSTSRARALAMEAQARAAMAAEQAAAEAAAANAAKSTPSAPAKASNDATAAAKPKATAPTTPAVAEKSPAVASSSTALDVADDETDPFLVDRLAVSTEPGAKLAEKTGGTVGAASGKFEITPSKMEPQADGSVLVEGAYRMTGDGSLEKPYEIPWEMLLTAEKTYNPTEKLTKIPQAIAMLDGKYVRVTGYVAFPMYVQEPRELLSMLNQWDGCCIGVPPTPYDAIEVTLKKTVEGDDRMATFGVVEGRFGVKPYVVGDWLVGLYVMDDGTLIAKRFNGSGT